MRGSVFALAGALILAGCSSFVVQEQPDASSTVTSSGGADDAGPPQGDSSARIADVAVSFAEVDLIANEELNKQQIPGLAIGIAKAGVVRYLGGYGYGNLANRTAIDPRKTLLRWASISKTLTGTLIAQLADEGRVSIDASIHDYYSSYTPPTTRVVDCDGGSYVFVDMKAYACTNGVAKVPLADDKQKVTLRQLATHTAGIQHYSNGLSDPAPPAALIAQPTTNTGMDWALKYFISQPLVDIPGARYHYSTFGANLAGVVLERVMGTPFDTLVQQRIAKKAGLTTLVPDYGWVTRPGLASGYSLIKNVVTLSPPSDNSWKLAGGGYISTVEDLTKYCSAFYGTAVATTTQKALLWADQRNEKGEPLGVGLFNELGVRNLRSYVQHGGINDWTRTKMRHYRSDGLCVVVMANLEQADVDVIMDRVEDAVRDEGL